ncbi:MAG TPA: ATP-dependent DNA helicase [Candidatus Saccharimonadales bacterium]|nr:ATP-dependent DNA helicase [Candidatus Saccharimonadales bacterium]
MDIFDEEFKRLNKQQRAAVETTEGPVLVLAGPGTGKTQLLSMRVANILRRNDVLPGNILCLTFTDNAARNMRERLATIIGQSAYHVAIHTFHSFGSDMMNQYPDYFTDRQLLQQIDELGRYELLHDIFDDLPHSNPLSVKVGENFVFLQDTLHLISWLKQNAVSPPELHELLNANQKFIDAIEPLLADTFASTPSPKSLPAYNKLLKTVQAQVTGQRFFGFPEYAAECAAELEQAISETDPKGRYAKPITAWRSRWCRKDADGKHVFKDGGQSYRRMHAVANVYQQLSEAMTAQGLYDFDDMVTLAVHAVEDNDELRYNLQERYHYVLVDEFQDTNKAQLRLLNALGDNPVHEGRPNLMAVGDDDQAIYAFQGAEASNMVQFVRQYHLTPIVLHDNYRSTAAILQTAAGVAAQLTDRLESVVPGSHKQLVAKQRHDTQVLDYRSFSSELAQYDWVAEEIEQLTRQGMKPEQIAVIAPRHRYLERLMPYLGQRRVPIAYERRENILEAPIILQLRRMSELVTALADNRQDDADTLFGEVLGYDFWGVPADTLVQISLDCYNAHKHWLDVLSRHQDGRLRDIASWFATLAKRSRLEPMEYVLDQLVGVGGDSIDSGYDDLLLPKAKNEKFVSPLRAYYFSSERYDQHTDTYLTLLGQLATLRHRLRQWKPNRTLYIADLVEFARLHAQAGLKIVDSNPHTQTTSAVQVMTAYKAKGLEFDAVFVINAQDEIWGPTARSGSSRISLPRNLPIEPAGDSDNDKLRLLFVALTRARHTLHITGYSHTLENKLSPALSFLAEGVGFETQVVDKPEPPAAAEILATDWAYRFRQIIAEKKALFEPLLANYQLSVTHLNNFLDVRDGGPRYFLMHNLLRFPEALSPSAAYGDAVHKTLQWAYAELRRTGKLPTIGNAQAQFSDVLQRTHLRPADHKRLEQRGREALERYLQQRGQDFTVSDIVERGFNNEGVVIAGARLSGKVDLLHFTGGDTVQVRDFKTGKPAVTWQGRDEYEKIKLHKYRQQLLFYKLLVEGSASFHHKVTVSSGALEFIEPDDRGKLVANLELRFDPEELERFARLIGAVWAHIIRLDFPDTSTYKPTLDGIKAFEEELLSGKLIQGE